MASQYYKKLNYDSQTIKECPSRGPAPGGPFGYCAPLAFRNFSSACSILRRFPAPSRSEDVIIISGRSLHFHSRNGLRKKLGPAFPTIRLMDPIGVERMGAFLIHIPPINYQFRFCAKLPSRSTAVGGPKNTFQQVIVFATAGHS